MIAYLQHMKTGNPQKLPTNIKRREWRKCFNNMEPSNQHYISFWNDISSFSFYSFLSWFCFDESFVQGFLVPHHPRRPRDWCWKIYLSGTNWLTMMHCISYISMYFIHILYIYIFVRYKLIDYVTCIFCPNFKLLVCNVSMV